ncbi:hypothetical protein [Flectobacillus roseus]|uniref:hypothetical protein n=1 Tax=Flectobacillus roseus TaxID=502259 RepID=UPI0024B6D402|nr:hypothetical protein [Flectobacillus roseus]MDI9870558.1 hypothetical protein [Flectobacillus roseus]
MAASRCPNPSCNSSSFETVEKVPNGSRFKLNFIQCSSCGTVVSVQDYNNIEALIYKLAGKLKINLNE